MTGESVYKVVIDSISAHVAILDENGEILETNRAWQEFARANGLLLPADCVGMNYLSVCDKAKADSTGKNSNIANGIRKVMAGEQQEFFTQYPCHSPKERRWFALRAVRFRAPGKPCIIVAHENITPIMETQEKLQEKEKELEQQTEKLEESNIALKVLLKHREEDRIRLEETVLENISSLVLPYVEKLAHARLEPREKMLAEIIENHLKDIISPFLNRLSAINKLLTPQEIQVAAMVRDGKTSKEIADMLQVSVSTVDFHRKGLRKKLNLSNTGSNLRSHLLSLR
ncbi:MAG: LuxR C-terminal-related transcriptional regulator [Desulfobulbaceae bacterium]|nr:LuxR C-terminal-related transcriptional regulator [Desulfobulbaceae bacterium]